jgi:hypothetical protein
MVGLVLGLVCVATAGCLEPSIDDDLDLTVRVVHAEDPSTGPPAGERSDAVFVKVEGAERQENTDENGEVRFHDLPPGLANVTVLTRRHVQPEMQSQTVQVGGDPVDLVFNF